jgi:hypothetical protein
VFRPGKLRDVDCCPITFFKGTQGKFKARIIASNITIHKATHSLGAYIRIDDSKRASLGYSDQGFSIT